MKTKFYKTLVAPLIILLIGVLLPIHAQTLSYTIQNEVQTASNVLEFDLYLLNKDAGTPIEISGLQAGIIINSSIVNGGTITAALVSGYSDMVTAEQPTSITYASATYCIKIAARSGPGSGNGTIMSTTTPGTRYCRVRLTNTVAFATASPNLTFNFTTTPYPTKLYAYIGGISTQLTTDATNTYNATANDVLNQPKINTDSIKNVGATSATGYAFITGLGYPSSITSYGFCYSSTNSTPTTADNLKDNGATSTTGSVTAIITGLTSGTTYYIRAYATNSSGTSYGAVKTITTLTTSSPTVTTQAVSNITTTTATGNGTVTDLGNPANITSYGICYSSTNTVPTTSDTKADNGVTTSTGIFTIPLTGLTPGTTYYACAYATNSTGTSYGTVATFTTASFILPTVTTQAVSNVNTTSATGNGTITDLGNPASITAYGICYSTTNTTPTVSDDKIDNGATTSTGTFTVSLAGLIAGTTYYVRAYATNSGGISYGEVVTFTTLKLATVSTQVASNIGTTTTTGNGTITDLGVPNPTAYGVCYSSTNNTPTTSDSVLNKGTASAIGIFTTSLTGLIPGTIYYLRAYATNTVGTSYGDVVSFTTLKAPTVATQAVSNINTTTATCSGNITDLGNPANVTAYGICYSSTNNTPTIADNVLNNGTTAATGAFQSSISDLVSGTTYYVRAFATNSAGTSYGAVVTFAAFKIPTVTTQAVSNISATAATGNGTLADLGVPNPTAYGVCYSSTNITPTISNLVVNNGAATSAGAFTASITGLSFGTTYYVRAYATNAVGTTYGDVVTFTTPKLPTVVTQSVSNISKTNAIAYGEITDLGSPNPTAYGVCYSNTNKIPTTSDNVLNNGAASSTGVFTSLINDLTPGVTYYVRAYATNSGGTTYGTVVSFTTLKAAILTTQAVSNITTTTAVANGTITDLGNPANLTAYGICYSSTNATPTIADNVVNKGSVSTVGVFTAPISGLTMNTTYYVRAYATNASGTSYGDVVSFTTSSYMPLSLKVYLQGLFNGVNMNQCLTEDGATPKFTGTIVDTITVELHSVSSYSTVIYRAHGLELHQDGTVSTTGKSNIEIPGNYTGSYYITIKTRNHVETTSSQSISFVSTASTLAYDFTTAAGKAYGNNMAFKESAYVIYAGDVVGTNNQQDGLIDVSDQAAIDNQISQFQTGYLKEDLNGDGIVDVSDNAIVEKNISNFVSTVLP